MNVYHKSRNAVYQDHGDGSLTQLLKRKCSIVSTIGFFRNDSDGQKLAKELTQLVKEQFGWSVYRLYRCPKNGRTYDATTKKGQWSSRRGSIKKQDAKVLVLLKK